MQQRSEETRTRLLEAALKRFAVQGYNAASIDQICAEAGVSKGAFYHHFPSKQAIFLELLKGWLETIDATLDSARQSTVPETLIRMTERLPGIISVAGGNLTMFLEFWLAASRDETIWKEVVAPYRRYQDYFATLVEQGTAEGSFRPVDTQATGQIILSLAVGIFLQALLAYDGADWQKVARQSMEILMNGLSANPKP
jgi:AcrR family transcriptional regulator